jgi:hypothetical protein
MSGNNREIEIKYRVLHGWHIEDFWRHLKRKDWLWLVFDKSLEACTTKDFYFDPPRGLSVVRLRDSYGLDHENFSKSLKEITIKCNDQGSTFNRLEENIEISDSAAAYRVLCRLYGEPKLTLYKDERVLFTTDGMVLSLAHVSTQLGRTGTLFLEIEGPTEQKVKEYAETLERTFDLVREPRALVEIYVPDISRKDEQ